MLLELLFYFISILMLICQTVSKLTVKEKLVLVGYISRVLSLCSIVISIR